MIALVINKKSGVAHTRECPSLVNVPDGALRKIEVVSGSYLPYKVCPRCILGLVPARDALTPTPCRRGPLQRVPARRPLALPALLLGSRAHLDAP